MTIQRHEGKLAPGKCVAQVWPRTGWPRPHQCSFKKQEGSDFCKVHDPVSQKTREDRSQAAWERGLEERRLGFEGGRMLKALLEISEGCNDARACAQAVLDSLDRDRKTGLKKKKDSDNE